jgi:hypothetical protein
MLGLPDVHYPQLKGSLQQANWAQFSVNTTEDSGEQMNGSHLNNAWRRMTVSIRHGRTLLPVMSLVGACSMTPASFRPAMPALLLHLALTRTLRAGYRVVALEPNGPEDWA